MPIICLANQKGGVAKTTSTFNLAVALAQNLNRVLMIDNDPQASLTEDMCRFIPGIDFPEDCTVRKLYEKNPSVLSLCFCVETLESDALSKKVFVIPSGQDMAVWETQMESEKVNAIQNFKNNLTKLRQYFDYILIDCPPSLGNLLLSSLFASDYVIIPVKTQRMSFARLPLLFSTIEQIRATGGQKKLSNPNLKVLGTIATMFRKASKEDQGVVNDLKEERHDLLGIVKESAVVTKSINEGKPVVLSAPRSDPALAYIEIAEKIEDLSRGD